MISRFMCGKKGKKSLVLEHHFSIRPIPISVLDQNDTTEEHSTAEYIQAHLFS